MKNRDEVFMQLRNLNRKLGSPNGIKEKFNGENYLNMNLTFEQAKDGTVEE